MSLKKRAVDSAFWGSINTLGNKGIQFIFGLFLARLLSPEDYGVLGVLTIFLSISYLFVDSGMGTALIRKSDVSDTEYSTVFYYNIAIAIFFYFIIFFSSDYIEHFFDIKNLSFMLRIFTLKIILESFAMIQSTILIKNLEFKKIAIISIISGISSGLVGIYFAYNNSQAWALIYQTLTYSIIYVLLHWITSSWKPHLIFSMKDFKATFSYSSKLLGASLVGRLTGQLNTVIIGKYLSPTSLGLYTRANSFKDLPNSTIVAVLSKVSLPILTKIDKNSKAYKDTVELFMEVSSYLSFGLMLLLIAIAPNLIPFLIGEQWKDAIIIFQILSVTSMIFPLQVLTLNILNSFGRSDFIFKTTWIKSLLSIPFLLISITQGLIIFSATVSIVAIFTYLINNFYLNKVFKLSIYRQIKLFSPFILIFLIISIFTFCIGWYLNLSYIWELIIQSTFYITFTLIISKIFKIKALQQLIIIITTFLKK